MSLTFALVVVPTICYTTASVLYATKGNIPLAVTYAGYAFANCGLLALDLKG